jgi:hypothetical protein
VDVEKTIEFLLNNPAKHEERLTRLEIVVGSLAGSVVKLADNVERLGEAMVSLAESEVRTNQRIDQLGMRVDQLGMRVDQLVGAMGAMIRPQPPQPNAG